MNILESFKFKIIIGLLISLTIASGLAFYYKGEYADAVKSLNYYKLTQEVLFNAKIEENKQIKEKSKQAIADVIADNKKQIADAGLDRKREANKLKGSINEISNTLAIANSAIQLRNDSTSANTLRQVPEDSCATSEAERNSNAQLKTVVKACKVTDYDYEALYNAWDKACLIHGCE